MDEQTDSDSRVTFATENGFLKTKVSFFNRLVVMGSGDNVE